MTLSKLRCHLFYTQAFGREQYYEVIEHVTSLINESLIGAISCLNNQFESLLANFQVPFLPLKQWAER